MTNYTEAEKELLIAMKLITLTRGCANSAAFRAYRANTHTRSSTDWTEAFVTLTQRGLLRREGKTWHLTEEGRTRAELVHRDLLDRCAQAYYRDREQHIGPDGCN